MSAIDMGQRLVRDPELLAVDMDGELVMMSADAGHYYGLNEVAARAWQLLEAPCSGESICATLEAEYDVAPEDLRRDMAAFLADLLARGLVRPDGG